MKYLDAGGVVLGIDIGGTNVRLAFVNSRGELGERKAILVSSLDKNDPLTGLVNVIKDFVSEHDSNNTLLAVGLGIPGIVDGRGNIISCPNIGFLENSDLKSILEGELGVPTFIEKDVNFILYGEYHTQGLKEINNLIGFYVGTGFGCSLLLNRDIYRGSHGFAGELGHIPLIGHTDLCNCGNQGCLELYGAGRYLAEQSANLAVDVADFFTSDATKDKADRFLEYVAVGMLATINVFDPELVIIGGGVPQMEGFPWDKLENRIRRGLRSDLIRQQLRIIPSQAQVYGGCLGAALYCFDQDKV